MSAKAIPIKCFVSHGAVSCDGGSVGQARKKKERTFEGVWVPEKAGLLSKKAWLQSQLENAVFSTIKCLNSPLKKVVSMLIKKQNIKTYQLLFIKQDRVLVNESTCFSD